MLTRRKFFKWLINASVVLGSGSINPFQSGLGFEVRETKGKIESLIPKIRVLGLGGAGSNAINYMMRSQLKGVDFIAANTDLKRLISSQANRRIQLGAKLTKGLGSGANPEIGRDATLETRRSITAAFHGSDIVFIVAGMGGGTGTGGAPVIAKISKDMGIPTLAVITKPFSFEGERRVEQAERGVEALRKTVDVLITAPNDRIIINPKMRFLDVLFWSDEILLSALDLAKNYLTKLEPEYRYSKEIENYSRQSAYEAIKNYFPEREIELIIAGISIGYKNHLETLEKAIPITLLPDLSGFRRIIIRVKTKEDYDIEELQVGHYYLYSILEEAEEKVSSIKFLSDEKMVDKTMVLAFATRKG